MSKEEYEMLLAKGTDDFSITDIQLIKGYLMALKFQLETSNNKLKEIKKITDKEKQVFIHDYSCITPTNLEAKLWNDHGTEFMDEISSIIDGNTNE